MSKKISSVLFLLLTILLALFLGSYNFLVVNTNATLPDVQMPVSVMPVVSNAVGQTMPMPPGMMN
jgi:hypothetical protein